MGPALSSNSSSATAYGREQCVHRDYGHGSTVCVCDENHCDNLDPIVVTANGVVTVYETSQLGGHRLDKTELRFGDPSNGRTGRSQTIIVDKAKETYQQILGFGGAFTDSAGLNIRSLPAGLQERLIGDYFADTGIEYTFGRIPIGGADFSTRAYTYDDNNNVFDFELNNWKLEQDDFDYKIPFIKSALKASSNKLQLIASTWSPPAWLKDNGKLVGGYLIGAPGGQHYKTYANYIVKFLDAYKAQGIPIWGLTVVNEPLNSKDPNWRFNCLGFTPETQRDFIKLDLGPALQRAGYGLNSTHLMIYDDNFRQLYDWARVIYGDREAAQYVSGAAFHWYQNQNYSEVIEVLDKTRAIGADKFMLNTEGCEEWAGLTEHVQLGSWHSFERYVNDIMIDLNHWSAGWVDWNLALDPTGGPNWAKNFVDAPIIVNAVKREYYKQPVYYALGHFSKFLTPGSKRMHKTHNKQLAADLQSTAFVRPDGGTVVIALNTGDQPIDLTSMLPMLQHAWNMLPKTAVNMCNHAYTEASLITIGSADEQAFLTKLLSNYSTNADRVWINRPNTDNYGNVYNNYVDNTHYDYRD
ncbi:unnamed protein product [Medioppia subpectinata]|uniref:Glucosylceramidase n=1 Tax=Medioppia subpectinata TaxID=1979941 RepID=A0A7R9KD82_9ACAR|nr:unnamed protein product [Medioppia subpectinata]CAG2100944.1 unnamed protein product [Medioppia subpectinata]